MTDPTRARELVERLRFLYSYRHDNLPLQAADMIDALLAERETLAKEVAACAASLPGPYYMDPPDGGDVSVSEQLARMAKDAARWRALLAMDSPTVCECADGEWVPIHPLRIAGVVDAAMGASDEQ